MKSSFAISLLGCLLQTCFSTPALSESTLNSVKNEIREGVNVGYDEVVLCREDLQGDVVVDGGEVYIETIGGWKQVPSAIFIARKAIRHDERVLYMKGDCFSDRDIAFIKLEDGTLFLNEDHIKKKAVEGIRSRFRF
jgi:hypothetical protein